MTKLLFAGILTILFSAPICGGAAEQKSRACTGAADCKVCKSCKSCKHCKENKGTCGVCKPKKDAK